jgi:putative aldouronate transport system permease protein
MKIQKTLTHIRKDLVINRNLHLMAIPVFLYYLVFHYGPMYGVIIAFKDFLPSKGIWRSQWIGLENFITFFKDYNFVRIIRNTFLINVYSLLFGFPIPIIFALLLNEIRGSAFKRFTQTVTYLPHFISIVVMCGIIKDFVEPDGLVVQILVYLFHMKKVDLLSQAGLFRGIYVGTGIWQEFGWNSIIYIAALTAIDPTLYEAAVVDGAGRFRQVIHITIPSIMPTIIILLILRIGQMMSVGYEKIILLYNPLTFETADVIQSYVYRRGLLQFDYSFSAAAGLFNSLINTFFVLSANKISKTFSETSLW